MSRFALAAIAFLSAGPAFADTQFFRAVEDLPVAPGLIESEQAFDFGGAQGRMVGATARGSGDAASVQDFYLETLPELGWAFVPMRADRDGAGVLRFQRGRESLVLELEQQGGEVLLDVRFVAQPASMNAD